MSKKQTAAPQSSPLPWSIGGPNIGAPHKRNVYAAGSEDFAPVVGTFKEADASLIVRRVNQGPAFDAMFSALESITGMTPKSDIIYKVASAALKLAQEVK